MTSISHHIKQPIDTTDRLIGHLEGAQAGPVIVFLAGIHGNEPAGVTALEKVMGMLADQEDSIKGNIYALRGNINALKQGIRYEKDDLNRIWTEARVKALEKTELAKYESDKLEQFELYWKLMDIIEDHEGPFYFMDLHTTSSHTIPFITLNDTILNRKFTKQFPVPVILGIEEYLTGPILSYINELGYVSFGFEGGQHEDIEAIENHEAFVYVSLVLSGSLSESPLFERYLHRLKKATVGIGGFFEIFYHHKIRPSENFKMKPGYVNFQFVRDNTILAKSNDEQIRAPENCRILMPLYQEQGQDGYFLIRKIAPVFLYLSSVIRKIKIDRLLTILPGISWVNADKKVLKINLKIARFFAKPIFHLLGYRSVEVGEGFIFATSRESASKEEEYQNSRWF